MTIYNLVHIDGVDFNVGLGSDNYAGKPAHEYFFTPFAVYDPTNVPTGTNQIIKVGVAETTVLKFKRKEIRIKLLQKIGGGHELNESQFIMAELDMRKINFVSIWDINLLSWKMGSDKYARKDLPLFWQKACGISRELAWTFSKSLVRAAYLEEWDIVDDLLNLVKKVNASPRNEDTENRLINALAKHAQWLYRPEVQIK